ncbi:MAG: radical SAM protein [Promethearchaeota archaeon]|nr:MAG: radical SAM protein [Candidatus Lokiarchaeota archaeon]
MYSLDLCITDRCNQSCPHCYVAPSNSMSELSTPEILDLLTECTELEAQNFHVFGGEPFIREDLEDIFSYAYDLHYSLSIATNGSLLDPKDFDWLQKYNTFLGISFHGPSEFHDSFCNTPGSYIQALTALKRAIKKRVNVGVITCLTKLNYHLYFSWLQSLLDLGVRTFFIIYFSPLGRGNAHPEYQLSNEEWQRLFQTLSDFSQNSPVQLEIFFEQSIIPKLNYPLYYGPHPTPCSLYTKSNCVVDANGDIYPCILFLRNEEHKLGNFRINSIHEIWNRYQPERREYPPNCRKCDLSYLCQGGCPAYYRDGMDFRCDDAYIPRCPLYPEKL